MDELHRQLFTVLMDHEWKHGVADAVDITLLMATALLGSAEATLW